MFNLSITQLLILSITLATYIKRIKHLVQFLYTMYSEHYERIYQKVSIIKNYGSINKKYGSINKNYGSINKNYGSINKNNKYCSL